MPRDPDQKCQSTRSLNCDSSCLPDGLITIVISQLNITGISPDLAPIPIPFIPVPTEPIFLNTTITAIVAPHFDSMRVSRLFALQVASAVIVAEVKLVSTGGAHTSVAADAAVCAQFGGIVAAVSAVAVSAWAGIVVLLHVGVVALAVFEDGWEEVAQEGAEHGKGGGEDDEVGFDLTVVVC